MQGCARGQEKESFETKTILPLAEMKAGAWSVLTLSGILELGCRPECYNSDKSMTIWPMDRSMKNEGNSKFG